MRAKSLLLLVTLIFSVEPFAFGENESVLFVIDIDGTLGEQSATIPDFFEKDMVKIPSDSHGHFYFFPQSIEFMTTIFSWQQPPLVSNPAVHIALFTMGSGPRNEIIRDYIADKLGIETSELNVFDYSEAVFSEDIVNKWRQNDSNLSPYIKNYLDSLEKPIKYTAPLNRMYVKDLSKLLPFYPQVKLKNIRILDDNPIAVPDAQTSQLIVAHPKMDFSNAIQSFFMFLESAH